MIPVGASERNAAWSALVAMLVILTACTRNSGPEEPAQVPGESGSAWGPTATATTANTRHVVIIVLENKEYSSIVGSSQAPYIDRLANRYTLATSYFANEHPSLPNYLDLIGGSDFGIHDDGEGYVLRGPTLVDQLEAAGLTWRAYMQGMPEDHTAPCAFPSGGVQYRKKHNPFAYFARVQDRPARCRNVVSYSRFGAGLSAGLPNFTWITPDMCNDMHDCGVATGDAWLARNVPPILSRLSGRDLLFVVFDEGSTARFGGGHVVCIAAGPGARRDGSSSIRYSHYSLLRTVEDVFGLGHLGHAGDSSVQPMSAMLS